MRCSGAYHPGLPVTQVTILLCYCEQCGSWNLYTDLMRHDENDELHTLDRSHVEFGPFDQVDDVLGQSCRSLERALLLPGRPWDPQHYLE